MATGIVSLAAGSQGVSAVAAILFGINLLAFLLLSFLIFVRLLQYRAELLAEASHPQTAPGFLTIVAAVAILGDEFAVQVTDLQVAKDIWLAVCGLWVGLVYGLSILLITRPVRSSLRAGINGSALLFVVATEALAVLGAHVADTFARPDIILFLSLCGFLLGAFFYFVIIVIIVLRWLFEPLPPEEVTPPYWINMGAMAIATLAGSRLELAANASPLVLKLLPALATATVLFWAVATWWIPLLLALMIWRHVVRAVPLCYGTEYWSMVFPLGMYTAATWNLAQSNHLEAISWIARIFVWAALAAWLGGCWGLLRYAFRRNLGPR